MPSHYKGKTGSARKKALKQHKRAMKKKKKDKDLMSQYRESTDMEGPEYNREREKDKNG